MTNNDPNAMSHFELNQMHFEVFAQATKGHTLLVLPREMKWDYSCRNRRRKLIMAALGQMVDLGSVTRVFTDEVERLGVEMEKRLAEFGHVTVYELVKGGKLGRRKKGIVRVHPVGAFGMMFGVMMDLDYNLASKGFRMKNDGVLGGNGKDERIEKIVIEV